MTSTNQKRRPSLERNLSFVADTKSISKRDLQRLDKALEAQTNTLYAVCVWLWENRKRAQRNLEYFFEYPDYGGMPTNLSGKLSPDTVDRIQEHWEELPTVLTPAIIVGWFLDV